MARSLSHESAEGSRQSGKLKPLCRGGNTHLVMASLEFMQRLAALIPRPRLHLIELARELQARRLRD